jgi:hypothetical protein
MYCFNFRMYFFEGMETAHAKTADKKLKKKRKLDNGQSTGQNRNKLVGVLMLMVMFVCSKVV